jgi:hypothetical protein
MAEPRERINDQIYCDGGSPVADVGYRRMGIAGDIHR